MMRRALETRQRRPPRPVCLADDARHPGINQHLGAQRIYQWHPSESRTSGPERHPLTDTDCADDKVREAVSGNEQNLSASDDLE